ncbi:MAG: 6-phosphogluconolactonase [Pseudomonadota bacterium]
MTGNRYASPHWHQFPDRESLAQSLADHVAQALERDLAERESVTLLVSGGRSPARFFECLAGQALDWRRVWVMPVDERVNAGTDDARNEWLIRHHLLTARAAEARFVPLETPMSAEALEKQLPWPATIAVLGMGEDGHCASWFPGDPALPVALESGSEQAIIATRASVAPTERLTLTWRALAEVEERVVLITGNNKRALFERIQAGTLDLECYPVARLLSAPLSVFWSP